jgi:hypothetical protein
MENANLFLESGPENSKRVVELVPVALRISHFMSEAARKGRPAKRFVPRPGGAVPADTTEADEAAAAAARVSLVVEAALGLGRTVALCHRPSTSYQIC